VSFLGLPRAYLRAREGRNMKKYFRSLIIPQIVYPALKNLSYKQLLKSYFELSNEVKDIDKFISNLEKELEQWKQGYWDLMYKRYMGISASSTVEKNIVQGFTKWIYDQTKFKYEEHTLKSILRNQQYRIDKLREDIRDNDRRIEIFLKRKTKVQRTLEMAEDPINQGMEEAHSTLKPKTLKGPQLKLLTGGKDGPPSGVNWLKELEEGSIFLCKKKGDMEYVAFQFKLDWKGERGALLSSNIPQPLELPVDTLGFSLMHELIELQRKGFTGVD
jgi:hypothetical protein